MYYTNPSLVNLHRVFDQNDRKDYLRLDLNENPGGLSEDIIARIVSEITPRFVAQYPETRRFSEMLAKYLGAGVENICLVNGSAEGIRYIIQAFTSERGKIIGVVPSYFMFQVYSEMYNREFVKIPYGEDLSMRVEDIVKAITEDVQLLILLNPNNPMGNCYTEEEFSAILKVAREKEVTVLVDEAYHYFYPGTFIKYAFAYDHIFITRTFSKLFSMAGCRLGYVVGWAEGIKLVQKLCTPHNTNAFALRFAEELISHPEIVEDLIEKFNEGRQYLIDFLDQNNYEHQGDAGNFIFIKPRKDADDIVRILRDDYKILIKSYSGVGRFGKCLRVSIGEKKFMEIFTNALIEVDSDL